MQMHKPFFNDISPHEPRLHASASPLQRIRKWSLHLSCLHLNTLFDFFRCQQSSAELESCSEKLHDVTEVAKKVKVSYPPEAPITLGGMKNKLEAVGQEMASIKSRKSQAAQAIMNNKVSG